jgi:hypothetical protein
MMIELNSLLFYTILSSYMSWFRNKDVKYIGYVNSTINASAIILVEQLYGEVAWRLFVGYLVYDTASIANNMHAYKNTAKDFIIHHLLAIYLCCGGYIEMYPEQASDLFKLERTVPLLNTLWFCRYYDIRNYKVSALNVLSLGVYTYYRVYCLGTIVYNNYVENADYTLQIFISSIFMLNMSWYVLLLNMARKVMLK